MITREPVKPPMAADLDDPLYYLRNMEMVVQWVASHHADLLSADERQRLADFLALPVAARGLLTRMVMRSGDLFRADKLNYPELPEQEAVALAQLVKNDWLDPDPELTLAELFRLFTLAELRSAFGCTLAELSLPKALAKKAMQAALAEHFPQPRIPSDWLGDNAQPLVRLRHVALFDRVRLMFFGNLRQSWPDFVLVELGYQRYETVPFTPESRAFNQREHVDCYLIMHQCREQLDAGVPACDVWPRVPAAVDNPWLGSRRDRLLLELGRQAERQGGRDLALQALTASEHREARLKQLRLLERMKRFDEAWVIARAWHSPALSDAEVQGLGRILKRLARKVGEPMPELDDAPAPDIFHLTLPHPGAISVEMAVAEHLGTSSAPVAYVENCLINGLFGLLCWEVIFAPIPGAFFHPYHVGPADLTREDFVDRRRDRFEACFQQLTDGRYRQCILEVFQQKQGLANPFVVWPVLSEDLLKLAMDCIPAAHLEAMFRRLLHSLKEHRSGFPDLIRFLPEAAEPGRRYEMIEVKGPGDRLQDHQVRWLAFFAKEGIPARVCYVQWRQAGAPE